MTTAEGFSGRLHKCHFPVLLCQQEEQAALAESKQEVVAVTLSYRDSYRYADGRRGKIGHWRQGAMASAYISIHLRCARVKWIDHCIGPTRMSPEIGFLADEMKLTSRRHTHIAEKDPLPADVVHDQSCSLLA